MAKRIIYNFLSFYPRHPRGWRRSAYSRVGTDFQFLSPPPSRVATPALASILQESLSFYPRHPRGWRHRVIQFTAQPLGVSIHATLAGGDLSNRRCFLWQKRFYPRHPRGWRPHYTPDFFITYAFLSTPPSRVATCACRNAAAQSSRFYPRHPRGWRLFSPGFSHSLRRFLSTPPSRVATAIRPAGGVRSESFYPRHPRGWRRLTSILWTVT